VLSEKKKKKKKKKKKLDCSDLLVVCVRAHARTKKITPYRLTHI